jgi:aminopeptidase-like protein
VTLADVVDAGVQPAGGERMHALATDLYPICRSLTGPGVRRTLDVIGERIPLVRHEVPSGTRAFDWTVPPEWTPTEAYVAAPDGTRVVDFADHTLHLVSYSAPFRGRLTLDQLRPHLHTLPDHPDWIPYRTSYYHRDWGFCLTANALARLDPAVSYEVVVDTRFDDGGSLSYAECVVPGSSDAEVLVSTHLCHPSLANDNLSGIAMVTELAAALAAVPHRYTYRFVLVPGTVGSITWLSRQSAEGLARIRHGLVVTGVGSVGPLVYKRTRHGDRPVDRAASHVVLGRGGEVRDFSPWGYDERQYNSPGFNLPVGRLTRTPHGEFPEYHTSADDLSFVRPDVLAESLQAYLEILDVLENDRVLVSTSPYGEPQLGPRGLYPKVGGHSADEQVMAMLWTMNLADGEHGLLDVAARAGLPFAAVRRAAAALERAGLLREASPTRG